MWAPRYGSWARIKLIIKYLKVGFCFGKLGEVCLDIGRSGYEIVRRHFRHRHVSHKYKASKCCKFICYMRESFRAIY